MEEVAQAVTLPVQEVRYSNLDEVNDCLGVFLNISRP
jgi:hypothetical protein